MKRSRRPALDIHALRQRLQARTRRRVCLIETHISWVLLCGRHAYKIKKPVRLDFLDFSTPRARRRACQEELRLNLRLARSLYIDVVPLFGAAADPHFEPPGPVVDHAVRMHRMPRGSLLSERLAAGTLLPAHVDRLAERVAAFHCQATRAAASSGFGTPQSIEADAAKPITALARQGANPELVGSLQRWLDDQARSLRDVWAARLRDGWVREGHGDLHLANAALFEGEALAFDCIEFDPALRWIDVISDAGFLVMDLLAHGRRDLGFRFLDRWLQHTGDHAGLAVLRHYLVYRALVRAMVATLRAPQRDGRAPGPDYLAAAWRLADSRDARLMITHGFSGSGKTFVTDRLLECSGAIRLRSDVERKRLFGLQPLQRSSAAVAQGIYDPQATERTFASLRDRAASALQAGYPTLVDATFLRAQERARFAALAQDLGVPFTILHCHAPRTELHRRVAARQAAGNDASDAGIEVLQRQIESMEPLTAAESAHVIHVDTEHAVETESLCARWHAGKLAQGDAD